MSIDKCPFCGSDAKQIEVEPELFCIECTGCKASSMAVYFLKEDGSAKLREAWNRRVYNNDNLQSAVAKANKEQP